MQEKEQPSPDRRCCINCFSDYAIRAFVADRDEVGRCDFCDSIDVHTVEVPVVASFIDRGIAQKYEDAAEQVAFESAEGGYQMDTLNVAEILLYEEEAVDERNVHHPERLANAIDRASTYCTVPLVRQHPYGEASGAAKHMSIWNQFCHRLKHTSRFTMFRSYAKHAQAKLGAEPPAGDRNGEEDELNRFWYDIDQFAVEVCVKPIAQDTPVYRARLAQSGQAFDHEGLTSPPPEMTRDSRMSPRGISYFYGTFDPETAVAEVRPHLGARIAVAEFRSSSHIYVLDLTEMPESKSIFDLDCYRFERDEFVVPFLRELGHEISKPIGPQDEAMAYLPTQAFCEFLQIKEFKFPIQGLKYPSAMRTGGSCLVLFRGPRVSLGNPPWLKYVDARYSKVESVRFTTRSDEEGQRVQ